MKTSMSIFLPRWKHVQGGGSIEGVGGGWGNLSMSSVCRYDLRLPASVGSRKQNIIYYTIYTPSSRIFYLSGRNLLLEKKYFVSFFSLEKDIERGKIRLTKRDTGWIAALIVSLAVSTVSVALKREVTMAHNGRHNHEINILPRIFTGFFLPRIYQCLATPRDRLRNDDPATHCPTSSASDHWARIERVSA